VDSTLARSTEVLRSIPTTPIRLTSAPIRYVAAFVKLDVGHYGYLGILMSAAWMN